MSTSSVESLITCRVGDALLGIDLGHVQEINRLIEVTFVPRLRPDIRGLINLRGSLVTVLDLATILRGDRVEPKPDTRNMIIEFGGERFGLLVDSVGDVLQMEGRSLEPLPTHMSASHGQWFDGLVQWDSEVLLVLNIDAVLSNRADEAAEVPS